MAIIKGQEIMLMINGKSVAFATNHTLNLNTETSDVSSKDHGQWGAQEINRITWEASTENLYCSYTNGVNNYDTLFDAMVAKQAIDMVFAKPSNWDKDGLVRGGNSAADAETEWNAPATSYLTGKCHITSLQLNAPNGENANYTATFTGAGPISRVGDSLV